MRTALELPVWLGNEDYYKKTEKFIEYYTQPDVMNALGLKHTLDIWLVENASPGNLDEIISHQYKVSIKRYEKHLTRTAHLEYPYCWRGLYFARDLFQEYDYDKVIHLNNDTYIISERYANHIRDFKSGWISPYCPRHKWTECDLQVITKDCKEYWELTGKPYLDYNGKAMETVIKAKREEQWIGDRHGEYLAEIPKGVDFSCQVRFNMKVEFNK